MNQRLVNYIKKSKEKGQTDQQIKSSLIENNWQNAEIEEAFSFIDATQNIDSAVPERIKKQRVVLLISIVVYLLFLILASPFSKPFIRYEPIIETGLFVSAIWVLGYGIKYIYSSMKIKSYSISFFILLFFWLIAVSPVVYALVIW